MLIHKMKPCPFCGRRISECSWEQDSNGIAALEVRCTCGVTIKIEADDVFRTVDRSFRPGLDALEKWNLRKELQTNTDCPWR